MSSALQPGELVIKRIRWRVDAQRLGIVIGKSDDEWLVMWMNGADDYVFSTHIDDALLVVDEESILDLRKRCLTVT